MAVYAQHGCFELHADEEKALQIRERNLYYPLSQKNYISICLSVYLIQSISVHEIMVPDLLFGFVMKTASALSP
jgi:hypothetical protein